MCHTGSPTVAEWGDVDRNKANCPPPKTVSFLARVTFFPPVFSSFFPQSSLGNHLATRLLQRQLLCSITREMLSIEPLQNEHTAWCFPRTGALHTTEGCRIVLGKQHLGEQRMAGLGKRKLQSIFFGRTCYRTEERLAVTYIDLPRMSPRKTNHSSSQQTASEPLLCARHQAGCPECGNN